MENLAEIVIRYSLLAWRRRWWAVAAMWAVCLAGWTGVAVLPDQYEAHARVYIDADAFLTPLLRGIAVESSLTDELDLLQQMMLSRPNLERIIAKTDLQLDANTPGETEQLVSRLANSIKVEPQSHNIFSITFRNPSRQLASDVVQAVLASFIENKAGDNRDEIDKAQSFLDGQIDLYEQQLRDAEGRRAAFKKKYIELLPGDGGTNRLELARSEVQSLTGQLADARSRRAVVSRELATTTPSVATEAAGGYAGPDNRAPLREAENKLRSLQQIYTDKYPEVITQRHLVETLRAAPGASGETVRSAGRSVPNPVYEQLKLKLVDTDALIDSLQRQVNDATGERDRLEKVARGVPELEAQYVNLNRDYDVVRKNYDELLSRREGMRISDAAQKKASNIKMVIIDPPTMPRLPVGPNRVLLSLGVLLAGIGAGAGLAGALVAFDQSFHSLADIRAMGLPVIGSISLAALQPTLGLRLRQAALFGTSFAALLVIMVGVLMHFRVHA